jgi:hypothetical protein
MKVAVLYPTKGRPEQARERLSALLSQNTPKGVTLEVIAAVCQDDLETLDTMIALMPAYGNNLHVTLRPNDSTAVEGWNQAYEVAFYRGAYWHVLGADDIVWHEGWLDEAVRIARLGNVEVIGFNDLQTNIDDYAPHYMVFWSFLDIYQDGYFIPPEYKTWWFDREICERAKAIDAYAPAWNAVLEHRHPDWKTAPMDDTYKLAWPYHDQDKATYLERRQDYESKSA